MIWATIISIVFFYFIFFVFLFLKQLLLNWKGHLLNFGCWWILEEELRVYIVLFFFTLVEIAATTCNTRTYIWIWFIRLYFNTGFLLIPPFFIILKFLRWDLFVNSSLIIDTFTIWRYFLNDEVIFFILIILRCIKRSFIFDFVILKIANVRYYFLWIGSIRLFLLLVTELTNYPQLFNFFLNTWRLDCFFIKEGSVFYLIFLF